MGAFGFVAGRADGRPSGFGAFVVMKPSSSSVSSESSFGAGGAERVDGVAFRGAFFFASAAAVDCVEVRPVRFAGD